MDLLAWTVASPVGKSLHEIQQDRNGEGLGIILHPLLKEFYCVERHIVHALGEISKDRLGLGAIVRNEGLKSRVGLEYRDTCGVIARNEPGLLRLHARRKALCQRVMARVDTHQRLRSRASWEGERGHVAFG